jgi:hypothetical protein
MGGNTRLLPSQLRGVLEKVALIMTNEWGLEQVLWKEQGVFFAGE